LKLNRRSLFRGLGGFAFAVPWLESFGQTALPKRFIALYHPNGVHTDQWTPSGLGEDFTFGASQVALEPFKKDLLYLQGLDLTCALTGEGEQHQRGLSGLLTGRKIEAGTFTGNDGTLAGWASGISVDQELVKGVGQGARLGSLQLGIKVGERDVSGVVSYSAAAAPLLPQSDPRQVFTQLFGLNPPPDVEGEPLRRRRVSVLDAVKAQFGMLREQVSTADRLQLDEHLQKVRELELKLTALPLPVLCRGAQPPPEVAWQTENAMPQVATLQLDLLVLALACDLTRVATVMFSDAKNHIGMPFLGIPSDVHGISHYSDADPQRLNLAKRDRWQAEQLAYLLGAMKKVSEGGGTMLDNSLVLWGSEVAKGNIHSHNDMPFLLAGHATNWRMGRVVKYGGRPHNDLLLSLLQGFGGTYSGFGDPAFNTGPLSNLA
jgi:hypothetical protein